MLVDGFMFYNELDILELRLEVLDRYVDQFILVEAEVNHVGGPKELFFEKNKQRYAKWLHKIRHIVMTAEEAPKEENPWCREKYQRDCILKGLGECKTADGTSQTEIPNQSIIMISDVDEIPDLSIVPFEKLPHIVNSVHMWMFEYSLDYLFTGEPWIGTVITNCELLKRQGPNYFRDNRWKFPVVQYAGWHLSSFGTPQHVWNKMQTFAHAKDGHHASQTPELFQEYITQGLHTDGKTILIPRPQQVPLPAPTEVLKRLHLGRFQ
jgi:beta-1,4-mannosyl-glycoprotein beta-1,4-N-acetylglucosaminyltransferase